MERKGTGDTDWNDFEKSLEVLLKFRRKDATTKQAMERFLRSKGRTDNNNSAPATTTRPIYCLPQVVPQPVRPGPTKFAYSSEQDYYAAHLNLMTSPPPTLTPPPKIVQPAVSVATFHSLLQQSLSASSSFHQTVLLPYRSLDQRSSSKPVTNAEDKKNKQCEPGKGKVGNKSGESRIATCDLCPSPNPYKEQVDAESLEIHGISHDAVKFQCAGCGLKMESYSQMEHHVESEHVGKDPELVRASILIPTNMDHLKIYQCGISTCGRRFVAQPEANLKKHIRHAHGEFYIHMGKGRNILRMCRLCSDGKQYNSDLSLGEHLLTDHPPSIYANNECQSILPDTKKIPILLNRYPQARSLSAKGGNSKDKDDRQPPDDRTKLTEEELCNEFERWIGAHRVETSHDRRAESQERRRSRTPDHYFRSSRIRGYRGRSWSREYILRRSRSREVILKRSRSRDSLPERSRSKDKLKRSRSKELSSNSARSSESRRKGSRGKEMKGSNSRDKFARRSRSRDRLSKRSRSRDVVRKRSRSRDGSFERSRLHSFKRSRSRELTPKPLRSRELSPKAPLSRNSVVKRSRSREMVLTRSKTRELMCKRSRSRDYGLPVRARSSETRCYRRSRSRDYYVYPREYSGSSWRTRNPRHYYRERWSPYHLQRLHTRSRSRDYVVSERAQSRSCEAKPPPAARRTRRTSPSASPGKPRERLRSESIAIETVDKSTDKDKDKQDDETAEQAQPVEQEPASKEIVTAEEPPKDGVETKEKEKTLENCTTDDCNTQPDHLEAIWKPGLETNSGALKSSEGLGLSEGFVEKSKDLSETVVAAAEEATEIKNDTEDIKKSHKKKKKHKKKHGKSKKRTLSEASSRKKKKNNCASEEVQVAKGKKKKKKKQKKHHGDEYRKEEVVYCHACELHTTDYHAHKNSYKHIRNDKKARCLFCPQRVWFTQLKSHVKEAHRGASFVCNASDKCFIRLMDLAKIVDHINTKHRVELEPLHQLIGQGGFVSPHLLSKHGLVILPADLKKLSCRICSIQFLGQDQSALMNHIKQEHPRVKKKDYKKQVMFECRGCDGVLFGSQVYLANHFKEIHSLGGFKPGQRETTDDEADLRDIESESNARRFRKSFFEHGLKRRFERGGSRNPRPRSIPASSRFPSSAINKNQRERSISTSVSNNRCYGPELPPKIAECSVTREKNNNETNQVEGPLCDNRVVRRELCLFCDKTLPESRLDVHYQRKHGGLLFACQHATTNSNHEDQLYYCQAIVCPSSLV